MTNMSILYLFLILADGFALGWILRSARSDIDRHRGWLEGFAASKRLTDEAVRDIGAYMQSLAQQARREA